MLVEVPMRVQTPPIRAPKDNGISSREGLIWVSRATWMTTGIRRATTAVSLIKADITPAKDMMASRQRK